MRYGLIALIALLLVSGCVSSDQIEKTVEKTPKPVVKETKNTELKSETNIKVYYFYHPRCPNCQAVEPMIDYLLNNTDIDFDMCNVEYFSNCSNISKQLALSIKEKTGFFGTPTAVVQENDTFRVFIGKYQVMDMVGYLKNYTYIPEIPLKNTNMSVEECLRCHEERKLKPPSTMTCSYCCHGVV